MAPDNVTQREHDARVFNDCASAIDRMISEGLEKDALDQKMVEQLLQQAGYLRQQAIALHIDAIHQQISDGTLSQIDLFGVIKSATHEIESIENFAKGCVIIGHVVTLAGAIAIGNIPLILGTAAKITDEVKKPV
jgi:hypothetical protein